MIDTFLVLSFALGPLALFRKIWQQNYNRSFIPRVFNTLFKGINEAIGLGLFAIGVFVITNAAALIIAPFIPFIAAAKGMGFIKGILEIIRDGFKLLYNLLRHPNRLFGLPEPAVRLNEGVPYQQVVQQAQNNINYSQSAHQQSVEEGVENIVKNWRNRYESSISTDQVLGNMRAFKLKFDNRANRSNLKIQAAMRFLDRVINNGAYMTCKPKSFNVRSVCIWAFHHMNQPANWAPNVTQADVDANYLDCIYNIQRAYNISDQGVDDNAQSDRITCPGGTINKIVYGLKSIVNDVNVNYMSSATALLKLERMTKVEMINYAKEHKEIIAEAKEIEFENIPVSAQKVMKSKIEKEFLDEFKSMPGKDKILSDFFVGGFEYVTAPVAELNPKPNR